MNQRTRQKLLLGSILAVGLALRLWGITFASSTPVGRPDEEILATGALRLFVHPYDRLGTSWPDGFFKLWHAALWLQRGWYTLRFGPGVNLGCLVVVRPLALFLVVRVWSAVMGTATAWVVGRIADTISPERAPAVGLWATAIYAVNYGVGRDGHFGVTDATLCFEIAVTLLCCARVGSHGSRWLVLAGFCAGLAFATKYSAVGLVFACGTAAVELLQRKLARAAAHVAGAIAAGAAGVLLIAPDIVTNWSEFRRGFFNNAYRYLSTPLPPGAIFYPANVLPVAFGWPGFLLCLVGIATCVRQRRGPFLIVYTALFYAAILGPLHAVLVRYASPLVPALAVFGGIGASWLTDRLRARVPPAGAVAIVALLALAIPFARLVAFDRFLARADTRDQARDWLVTHAPDSVVLTEGVYGHVQAIDASVAAVCRRELPPALWRPTPVLPAPRTPFTADPGIPPWSIHQRWLPVRFAAEPVVAGAGERGWERISYLGSARYLQWDRDERRGFSDLHSPDAPDYLARAQGPSALGWAADAGPPATDDGACWSPVARFVSGNLEAATWDAFDAFFTPFTGLGELDRPGPDISIYKNDCKGR